MKTTNTPKVTFTDEPIPSVVFKDNRIQIVVVNEEILGYILPEIPHSLNIFMNLSKYGAKHGSTYLSKDDTIRLANVQDFSRFRVSEKGFLDNPNEYLMEIQ